MTFRKQVALPTTLTDLLVARQDAMRLIEDSHRTLQKAEEVLAPYGHNLMPYEAQPRESLDRIRKELDGKMWRRAMDLTGFKQLMDAEEADKLEKSLFPSPAEFTDANVRATFIDLQIRSEEMFRRGVFNVFRHLSDDYRRNKAEPFRMGSSIIMRSMVRPAMRRGLCISDSMNNYAGNKLNDIDRVVKTLDKKRFDPRSLEAAMNEVFENRGVYEDEYFRAKSFKNGNLHLEFKRLDLLDKLNEQIADYYTYNALADGRAA
ncbi:DUF4942 domain-containing protein [Pseudomonas aeruginosa]|uniref:DUF4942 domain-containing protein n=1 Tax=Pseudomonas aeruginosa TaxID=287 RepID=UPI00155E5C83|nr:DUF4942 domain-containing protein [Pseudomonas aeruginosa]NRC34109.1 DUF4942 domain-containing protein [Pseudomonas aeruginosa]